MIGRLFHIDPVAVLASDEDVWEIRVAAAEAAIRQMKREANSG